MLKNENMRSSRVRDRRFGSVQTGCTVEILYSIIMKALGNLNKSEQKKSQKWYLKKTFLF